MKTLEELGLKKSNNFYDDFISYFKEDGTSIFLWDTGEVGLGVEDTIDYETFKAIELKMKGLK